MDDEAVVLGAGIAGLLAATVLAERFSRVTVVERDRLPDKSIDRRGAPQGRHLHSLLSRGWQTIDALLPGFLAELVSEGATVIDDANMARIHIEAAATRSIAPIRWPIPPRWSPTWPVGRSSSSTCDDGSRHWTTSRSSTATTSVNFSPTDPPTSPVSPSATAPATSAGPSTPA